MTQGPARLGRKTKELTARLRPGDLAVIDHADLDEVAADALVRAGVSAVINVRPFLTGRFPHRGPEILLQAGVTLVEGVDPEIFSRINDGEELSIDERGNLACSDRLVGQGSFLTLELAKERRKRAEEHVQPELERFVSNTLAYAAREKEQLLGRLNLPDLPVTFANKQVVVTVRGPSYREDLQALHPFLQETSPLLVAVDGGADALRDIGLQPDLIVGDMDSVSDATLKECRCLVIHAYPDGRAPGLARIEKLGLRERATVIPLPGTSEDLALLLSYEKGASLLVLVGGHSNLVDFLEKGRPGMASTLLTRLKVGPRLVDARGVSALYRSSGQNKRGTLWVLLAAAVPIWLLALLATPWNHLGRFLRIWVSWRFGG